MALAFSMLTEDAFVILAQFAKRLAQYSWRYCVFFSIIAASKRIYYEEKYLWMLFAILAIVCSVSVITCNNSKEDAPSVSPTDNSSEFVTLTDVVPDAILEIRTRKGGGSGPLCLVYHAANIRKNRIW